MEVNPVRYRDGVPLDGYGPGFFRIGGEVYEGSVAVLPCGVVPWGGLEDAETLLTRGAGLDVMLVGTGAEIAHLPNDLRVALEGAGIGAEVMASAQACRTYNVLLGEGRRVGLALLPL